MTLCPAAQASRNARRRAAHGYRGARALRAARHRLGCAQPAAGAIAARADRARRPVGARGGRPRGRNAPAADARRRATPGSALRRARAGPSQEPGRGRHHLARARDRRQHRALQRDARAALPAAAGARARRARRDLRPVHRRRHDGRRERRTDALQLPRVRGPARSQPVADGPLRVQQQRAAMPVVTDAAPRAARGRGPRERRVFFTLGVDAALGRVFGPDVDRARLASPHAVCQPRVLARSAAAGSERHRPRDPDSPGAVHDHRRAPPPSPASSSARRRIFVPLTMQQAVLPERTGSRRHRARCDA